MEVPALPKIVLSPNLEETSRFELQSIFNKSIRGSNFKSQANLFKDTDNQIYIWKKLRFNSLVNEYVVSYLANAFGIKVPRSYIGFTGHSFGLIQEWIADATELSHFDLSEPKIRETDLYKLIVFLAWIGAKDRHGGNYLIKAEGDFYAIDFEECFTSSTNGSEICLYFPSILQYREKLIRAIQKLEREITITKLEQIKQNLTQLIHLPDDERAQRALRQRIGQIFELLFNNLRNLDIVVDEFMVKSTQPQETISFF
ncbi:MAG: hypothetical protein EAX86_11230 [Candidatus Heimdallarchaeota archaeon]|nr:hypothetical protein [Candidatus Heimdallarchaeota archaeon]